MKKRLTVGIACIGLVATPALAGAEWTYEGPHGADRWGQLHKDFEMCERGIMQSPIDLGQANATGEIDVTVNWQAGPLTLLHNGHTVQASFAEGSTMISGGKSFKLVQVHFHTPSEHTVDGKAYPLTAHFVHAADDGALAVLGVMFEEGDAHSELQKLVSAAPKEKRAAQSVPGVSFDPMKLLPEDRKIYRYMGSLTTPPCSEGVNWHVLSTPVEASAAQIAAMEEAMGMNARPVQLLNGRLLVAPE
ncbi:MAG: carbonic anhydrase family protein [Sphingomonadaceae bacterium]